MVGDQRRHHHRKEGLTDHEHDVQRPHAKVPRLRQHQEHLDLASRLARRHWAVPEAGLRRDHHHPGGWFLMAVNIKITFRPEKGAPQTLWGQVRDWDKLRELQAYTKRADAADLVLNLDASLKKGGEVFPRVFRASRTTIEEDK
jgi:hypothetical protein